MDDDNENNDRGGDSPQLKRRSTAAEFSGDGASSQHVTLAMMEDILDKLKMLGYEKFMKKHSLLPIPRHYFAIPAPKPAEQFRAFTAVVAFLMQQCGNRFDPGDEQSDPNVMVSAITMELKKMGMAVDFPPTKLKQAHGEIVCNVLQQLTDAAINASRVQFKRPVHKQDDYQEDAEADEDAEVTADKIEDEHQQSDQDEPEDNLYDFEASKRQQYDDDIPSLVSASGGTFRPNLQGKARNLQSDAVLESDVDPEAWRLEVERVTPMLKVHILTDNKDWRMHYDEMKGHQKQIGSALTETKTYLDNLHTEIGRTLEKIASREKYINGQLEHLIQQYRSAKDDLSKITDHYKNSSGTVTERTNELSRITEELEQVKAQMDERGSSMTDSSPLVKIKQALARLKKETVEMEVRIGVVEHTLLSIKLRSKAQTHQEAHAASEAMGFAQFPVSF
eukprot:Opistho-2@85811